MILQLLAMIPLVVGSRDFEFDLKIKEKMGRKNKPPHEDKKTVDEVKNMDDISLIEVIKKYIFFKK